MYRKARDAAQNAFATQDAPFLATMRAPAPADVAAAIADGDPDMILFAAMAGGGDSNAILALGEEDGAGTTNALTRLFQNNTAFHAPTDLAIDVDNRSFFVVDSDAAGFNRILRGSTGDLLSGTGTPTLTPVFSTSGNGEAIAGIELDKAAAKIYWTDGSLTGAFDGGYQLWEANYDGSDARLIQTIDTENSATGSPFPGGVGDFAVSGGFAYVAHGLSTIDGSGNATVYQNHILRISLGDGAVSYLDLGTSPAGYQPGRLPDVEGVIVSVDVDQRDGTVYFVTQPTGPGAHGGIYRFVPGALSGSTLGGTLTQLWEQPAPNDYDTLQSFPIANLTNIEFDEIGNRYFVSATSDQDTGDDDTPLTNQSDAAIFVGNPAGGAPSLFGRAYEPTSNGAPLGMEINYAPILIATDATTPYVETAGPGSGYGTGVSLFDAITVSDADNATLSGIRITFTAGYRSTDLIGGALPAGLTYSYNPATGAATISGQATVAAYQAALSSLTFTTSGDNPTDFGTNASRTLSLAVYDGMLWSDVATTTIEITAINDAPVNTVPGAQTLDEDGSLFLGAAGGNAISIADPDGAGTQSATVVLSVLHGTLAMADTGPATVIGDGTATVTLSGTLDQINAALAAGVTYAPIADYNGGDAITVTSTDLGNTGGVAASDVDTITLTISAIADIHDDIASGDEDSAITINVLGNDSFSNADATITAFGPAGNGSVAIDTQGTADTSDDRLVYTGGLNFFGTDSFTYTVTSGGVTETATVTVTVNAVDDVPIAVAPTGLTTAEDATLAIDPRLDALDVDGGPLAVIGVDGTTLAQAGDFATLASGAIVTLLADGSLQYDANGAFDGLVSAATAAAFGLGNAQATDSFTFTLNGGSTATAEVIVTGVDGAGDMAEGTAGADRIRYGGQFGGFDGGAGRDTMIIGRGADAVFTPATLTGFERFVVQRDATLDLSAFTDSIGPIRSGSSGNRGATIIATGGDDVIAGGGAADTISGGAGNDQIMLSATPARVDGGIGDDLVIIRSGSVVMLDDSNFTGVERLRVDDAAIVDLSALSTRLDVVVLNSVSGGGAVAIGTRMRDNILGGAGDDVIIGLGGGDRMTGGNGADTFVFTAPRDFGEGPFDEITDFTSGQDRIDVSAIDTRFAEPGDQGFTFIDGAAFSGAGDELRVEAISGGYRVEGDLNGDMVADFALIVRGEAPVAGDFVL